MKKFRTILAVLALLLGNISLVAQDVTVTVTSVQQVLPPQALLYMSDPGKYFNITLINNTNSAQDVYLAMSLEQTMPSSGLSISTPPRRQPQKPFSLTAGQVRQLTLVEMKTLFNHVPKNEIKASSGLLDNFSNGSFGLLPEGQYKVQVTAYKWNLNNNSNPVAVSSPTGGVCYFNICYKAQSPEFITPAMSNGGGLVDLSIASLNPAAPQFTWKAPVLTCNANAAQFTYDFKIVELLPNQQPDAAIDRNATVYSVKNLMTPIVTIPATYVSKLDFTKTYIAQVQAKQVGTGANMLNYVMIENSGKSPFRMFKLVEQKVEDKKDKKEDKVEDDKEEDNKDDEEDQGGAGEAGDFGGDLDKNDSMYVFKNPVIENPMFEEDMTRKLFLEDDIEIDFKPATLSACRGSRADTVKIEYTIDLFKGKADDGMEKLLKGKPIYTTTVKDSHEYTIPWEDLEKQKIEHDDYMVLRITPKCTNTKSIRFEDNKDNIIDFAMSNRLSKSYFQCSSTVVITNTTPTEKQASDLKGKTVAVGEYELTIDKISGDGKKGFSGEGRVKWQPLGTTIMVCVKFDKLMINTDDIVYKGECVTYAENQLSDIQVVDKLFSDWGIDNLIGDTGLPSSKQLQQTANNKVKDLAKKINLSKYYNYVKKGNAFKNLITKGKIDKLYMPVGLPKEINKTPVDIQICKMKFAADYATMDIIGEFTLPNTNWTKNDILVLGAPRLCISPKRILPEAGTIALLSDFNIKDPKSSYEMDFKAPKDVMKPVDGCYIAWKADKLEIFGIDVDMKIPKLVKDKDGTATKEQAVLNVRTSVSAWDDWMVDNVTIDPFQVEDLPGWTFTATDIVYDHSVYRNSTKMGKFPSKYDKKKSDCSSNEKQWQGLYIKKIGVKFPKSLEIGSKGNERLELAASDMFIDKSGATLDLGADKVLKAQTGKVGGWSFSLDKIGLSFVQNDFKDCHFSGKFSVPLLSGKIGYSCQIMKMTSNTKNAGQFAYVFKTQQVDNLSLDFFLAEAKFKKDQTYFLLESLPTSTGQDTKVELVMGGDLTIGGTDYLNKKIKNSKLPLKFEIPGVHFCGMRLANCTSSWKSKFESKLQAGRDAKLSGKTLYQGKEFELASKKIYFHTGRWSLASPSKKLGPFEFALDKYKFDYSNKKLKASLEGSIKLISGIELSAGAGFTIYANVTLPKDLNDLSSISASYDHTDFEKASFDSKFAGMQLSGELTVERNSNDREGYAGKLTFHMPGDLFYIDANGGYFKKKTGNKQFTYGWFYAAAGGKAGIPIDPAKIHRISAGFYYNCKKNGTSADPEEGIIGVVAGLGLSTSAGEDMLSADLDLTVVYDSKNKRLSTFLFQGKIQAVEGLVKADVNVLYQHDNRDQYFKLDITVDASADGEKLAQKVGGSSTMKSLSDLKTKLNSSYKKITKRSAQDGLGGKVDDSQGNPGSSKSGKNGSSLSASAGAKISLQFMITMKKNGSQCKPAKWHVYLGEPDIDKRCTFTFLKVKSSVLSVNIGANAYVCVGNELPNNGKLPDIPYEIRKFLDGNNKSGIESADVSKANRAREQSLKEFNDQIATTGGGVMFGAQVYGYLDVDLGIFYLNAGATAGFDISIIKLPSNAYCTNIKGDPGWKRWYGYGQLYAYLYAKFGLRLNLGFWKKDFDVADCGIGGVFRMQGPKPSHFDGEARVKMKLLGGLIDINRKYQFSCGDECDLFMGNALDEFKLFGDLTIGNESKEKGWADKNKIDPDLLTRPCFYTEAPLKEPFRVLDQTELARLKKSYDGDPADLEMEASRTFIFRSNVESKVTLKEYTSKNSRSPKTRTFYLKGQSRYANYIDITQLSPNCYYEMTVSGYAKEIQKGREVDPVNYDTSKKKYVNKAWNQSKTYYFATGPRKAVPDVPELQDYIAIAYPSHKNRIMKGQSDSYISCHENDIKYPSFALITNLKNKAFTKGTLKWRLYNSSNKMVCERNNSWVTTSNTCNMQPSSALSGYSLNSNYKIKLEYELSKRVNNKYVTETSTIAEIWVTPRNSNWKEGYSSRSLDYEKPFVGCRINSVTMRKEPEKVSDYNVARFSKHMLMDPYMYIAALSNYIFIGGWEFGATRIDVSVTTAQSCIYTDKGGVYEGKLGGAKFNYNCYNDYEKIKKLSIFDYSQYKNLATYPLPAMDGEYSYALTGLDRAAVYTPSSKNYVQVANYINDWYRVYALCETFSTTLMNRCKDMDNCDRNGKNFTQRANNVDNWYNSRRGQYISNSNGAARLQVPAYQFPIIYGSCLENKGVQKKITAWGSLKGYSDQCKKYDEARGHEVHAEWVFSSLLGKDKITGGYCDSKGVLHSRDAFVNNDNMKKAIKSASFSVYRVNAYDFNNCQYTINSSANGGNAYSDFKLDNPLLYYNKK